MGRKRVARLMQAADLQGVSRRRRPRTTLRGVGAQPVPDLVERDFAVAGPNRPWVADITDIPTGSRFLFLAVVVEEWSRRVVGWSMASHLRTERVLDAPDMAIRRRRRVEVIHHSDHGGRYTSIAFGRRCQEAGVRPSMGSVGDYYDNAVCESFFATLECELLDQYRFGTRDEARRAVFEFIEGGAIRIVGTLPFLPIACTIREGIRVCRLSRPSRHLSTISGQLQQLRPRIATRSLQPVATSTNWGVWTYWPVPESPLRWTRSTSKCPGSGIGSGRRSAWIERVKGLGGEGRVRARRG